MEESELLIDGFDGAAVTVAISRGTSLSGGVPERTFGFSATSAFGGGSCPAMMLEFCD